MLSINGSIKQEVYSKNKEFAVCISYIIMLKLKNQLDFFAKIYKYTTDSLVIKITY